MAYVFGDGFDCYATTADTVAGYWDSGTTGSFSLTVGRFAGSQCVSAGGASVFLTKSSGANDAVHHIVCAFNSSNPLTGTNLGLYLRLTDNVTDQVSIVFRSDGAILLASGTFNGTVLATYSGAVTAQNTWFAFEFEVVISATVGRFRARKNGNATDDFDSGATLNTRPGTNAYANKLSVGFGNGAISTHKIDDILWRSDASSVPFVGDIRAYTRMPASDASAQFARSPSPVVVAQSTNAFTTGAKAANFGFMSAFVAAYSGTISSASITLVAGGTGNMKAAIYDSARVAVLATSNAVVNPVTGVNTITFGTPLAVTKGITYHLAFDQDVSLTYNQTGANQFTFTTVYASFPAASPALTSANGPVFTVNITPTISAEFVNETLQDGTTSYVYSGNVNDADLYNIAPIASTPVSVVAVTTRGFLQKSDAGTRGAAVQLKSGATTVGGTPTLLGTSFGWLWRTDLTDPATSTAWTPTGVNGVQIGPKVTS